MNAARNQVDSAGFQQNEMAATATAMAEPDPELVNQVFDIINLDRVADTSLVVAALKDKNYDVGAVVMDFFDDEGKFRQRYSWDESVFSTDRDGTDGLSNVPTFNIHAPDEESVIQGIPPAPPTRPPSRANTRSPLGRLIDLTADDATGGRPQTWNERNSDNRLIGAPNSKAQEDADLQRAIAESVAQQPSYQPPQESGIMLADNTSTPHFGPANREEYDPAQWGMVTVNTGNGDPSPSARKRAPGTPAFLTSRRGWFEHRLGALLTILHAIPAARNVLLRLGSLDPETYGSNDEWWKGDNIVITPPPDTETETKSSAKEVDNSNSEELQQSEQQNIDNAFYEELQRLMAFLDATDRSYGTADILANIKAASNKDLTEAETLFYTVLGDENLREMAQTLLMNTEVVPVKGIKVSETILFGFLDVEVVEKSQYEVGQTLYNALDALFWGDLSSIDKSDLGNSTMAVIERPAEIFALRLNGNGIAPSIEIPEVLYLDRYLKERKQSAAVTLSCLATTVQAIDKSQETEEEFRKWTHEGKVYDKKVMHQKILDRDHKRVANLKAAALWRRFEELKDTNQRFDFVPGTMDHMIKFTTEEEKLLIYYKTHVKLYEQKMLELDQQLARLQAEREAYQELLRKLGRKHTGPAEGGSWVPTHKYHLRGVATALDVMYLCRKEKVADQDSTELRDQWWRLAYVATDGDPVKVDKTTLNEVLKAVCTEADKPILVYATEKALTEELNPLSSALKTFVRVDNRLFKHELIEESPGERKRAAHTSPLSPMKRQYRSSSVDSMATNRASIGSDTAEDITLGDDPEYAPRDGLSGLGDDSALASSSKTVPDETGQRSADGSATGSDELPATPFHEPPHLGEKSLTSADLKDPEMQERSGGSPFLTRPKAGATGSTQSPVNMNMEMPDPTTE